MTESSKSCWYYSLETLADICELAPHWHRQMRAKLLCSACPTPKRPLESVDVKLSAPPPDVPLTAALPFAGVIRDDLLGAMGYDLFAKHFHLGTVLDAQGRPYRGFTSFNGKCIVRIRGGRKSVTRVCEECGTRLYTAIGKWYLLSSGLPDAELLGAKMGGIIVSEEICRRIMSRKWPELGVVKLPVLDEPRDGLSERDF